MRPESTITQVVEVLTATILSSETVSDAVVLNACKAAAVQTPAVITGTSLKFQGSIDNGETFELIKDITGADIEYTVAANGSYPLDTSFTAAYDQIKLVMDAQAAETSILVKAILT